jgi:predicted O-methyltransferase YrrM
MAGLATKLLRSWRRAGLRGLVRDVRNRLDARPTALPLDTGAIRAGLARAAPAESAPPPFPAVAELETLWPVLLHHRRALQPHNPGDPYFDPADVDRLRAAGRRIEKNLFEIWLFLRWRPATLLEIGTRTGLSLCNKLAFLDHRPATTTICVDPYFEQGAPRVVRGNLRRLGAPTDDVHFLVGDSKTMVPALAQALPDLRFDYVLVDGSHARADARADLQNTLPLVAPGGVLVFDDAGPTAPGVVGHDLIDVWTDALAPHADAFETHHYDVAHGFCVARRLGQPRAGE